MDRKINKKGFTLAELLIAVAIIGVLVGIAIPVFSGNLERAKRVKVEYEASVFLDAARIAYLDVLIDGKEPRSDSVKNKTSPSSPYYKSGTKYGNLTNWTVHNGVVAGASNGPFADAFFNLLGISYGKEWKNNNSTIPISEKQPKINPGGSLTKECVFQVFYTSDGFMVVEYSREGYFVRIDNTGYVESIEVKSESERHFTTWG